MKRVLAFLIVITFMLPMHTADAAALKPDPTIKVFLNGEKLAFDIDPVRTQGTTLVQFTTIFEALGLDYEWNQKTKTVEGYKDGLKLSLTINDQIANVNGFNIQLNVAPTIHQSRTLVPLRFISEATGMKVTWLPESNTITIDSDSDGKLIERPNRDLVLKGMAPGDTSEKIEQTMGGTASNTYDSGIYTYFTYENVDFFGYDSLLNFGTIFDHFVTATYVQVQSGGLEDESLLSVYTQTHEELKAVFGAPNGYGIYETVQEEGKDAKEVEGHISEQRLIQAIENGEYFIRAFWSVPDLYFYHELSSADDGTVYIEAHFIAL